MRVSQRQHERAAPSERRPDPVLARASAGGRAPSAWGASRSRGLALGAAFGALAFGACTLTSDEFQPRRVERGELLPDASVGPSLGCVTALDCSGGQRCEGGVCSAAEAPAASAGDAGASVPCVGSDCPGAPPLALEPSCADGVQNGDERGVDCGGPCAGCSVGAPCATGADCLSGTCSDAGACPAPTCDDGVVNQGETGSDCGGPCERGCEASDRCLVDGDCAAGLFCPPGTQRCTPVSCGDGVRNGVEVLVDCGGGACAGCPDGSACSEPGDCASGVCRAGTCAAPACDDEIVNQDETDVDCGGGSCAARCATGNDCTLPADCASGVCRAGACAPPACNDGVVNQNETDVDCGGSCNRNCPVGDGCQNGGDCQTGVCGGAGCGPLAACCQVPACDDGVQNGNETAIDCGNAACGGCPLGSPCVVDAQCALAFCQQGECADPGSCVDGALNGRETGVDCGGDDCPPCADLAGCEQDTDCSNNNCDANGVCISCGDFVQNGTETGVDCGGADVACRRCNAGERCTSNDDCSGLLCIAGVCG